MTAYISIALSRVKASADEVNTIKSVLEFFGLNTMVFVEKYQFKANQENDMMRQAMADINACDLFVAEVSEKAIGVGLEAGYAKAKGKTVVYVRHKNAEHSTTVSGISDYHVIYSDVNDLKSGLEKSIKLWISERGISIE